MTALAAYELPPLELQLRVNLDDRVSVPDGRVGTVIGFYRREVETVLVLFDFGDSSEYADADLRIVA